MKTLLVITLAFTAWLSPIKAVSAHQIAEPKEETPIFINYAQFHKTPQVQTSQVQPSRKKPIYSNSVSRRSYSAEAGGDIQLRMQAKVIAKWGVDEWPAMHYIMDHESGSNPYAVNKSSGACGIPQALPCGKLLRVIGSLDNVDGQLDWMLNYVASRYGTPTQAMAFHQTHNWY